MGSQDPCNQPVAYQIWLRGSLDPGWADWFGGFTITHANGNTRLIGAIADQAALRGLVDHILDLNITVLSIERIEN